MPAEPGTLALPGVDVPAAPARAVPAGPFQAARVGGGGELEAPARHRPAGPRSALPDRVGLAGIARGGSAHGAGGERLRGRGRPDRGVLRRARRRGAHARHRRHHVLPGDPARADPGGHGGPELHQRGDRHRGDPVGPLRARHPRPGAHPHAPRLRGPGAHRGGGGVADHHPAPAAQYPRHPAGAGHAPDRLRDHRGGLALLPGCGHPGADPGVGFHDRGGARRGDPGVVGLALPGARDPARGARLQPARVLAARHLRPEAQTALSAGPPVSSPAASGPPASGPVIDVRDLRTHLVTRWGTVKAVDGVSFTVAEGETLGLVGESGSGKSMTCLSLLRLVPRPAARILGGRVLLDGEDLLAKSEAEMRKIRGRRIGMILQDPMSSLNPVFSIGMQVREPVALYHGLRGSALAARAAELLAAVQIPSPAERLRAFPHQLSGGMRQRVVGAMAIAAPPRLLIADEPTTSLDLTIQAQYLGLLKELQERHHFAMIFVTHNLGIVAKMCERVAVMYAGRIVEMGPVREIFTSPRHPYTQALLESVPRLGARAERLIAIEGQPPDLARLPAGCAFAPRCPSVMERCRVEAPPETLVEAGHVTRCWLEGPGIGAPAGGTPA